MLARRRRWGAVHKVARGHVLDGDLCALLPLLPVRSRFGLPVLVGHLVVVAVDGGCKIPCFRLPVLFRDCYPRLWSTSLRAPYKQVSAESFADMGGRRTRRGQRFPSEAGRLVHDQDDHVPLPRAHHILVR